MRAVTGGIGAAGTSHRGLGMWIRNVDRSTMERSCIGLQSMRQLWSDAAKSVR